MTIQQPEQELAAVEAEIADIAGVLNVAHGRLVALTTRVIDADLWQGWGIRSVEHWLTLRAGVSRAQAGRVVRLAQRCDELPVTTQTLAAGELTLDQASAVADLAPAHADAAAASLAKATTVSQLRTTLSRYRFHDDPAQDAEDAEDAQDHQPLDGSPDGSAEASPRSADAAGVVSIHPDGPRFRLHADLPADAGALVEQALREAKDALFHTAGAGQETGQADVGWSEALLEICSRSLAADGMAPSRLAHYRTWIHLDVDADAGWINQGPALPTSLLDKLTCEGKVQPLWLRDGIPVSVGRSTRVIPARLHRLVLDRDRCCVVPGCGARHHLEVHHVKHWSRGGRTDSANLAALCPAHHDGHHRGEFTICGDADVPGSLIFTDPHGNPLCRSTPPTPPTGGLPAAPRRRPYQPPTGEPLHQKWVHLPPTPTTPKVTPQRT